MRPGLGDTQVPALPDVLPAPSFCRLPLIVKAPRSRGLMAQSSCPSDCYAFPEASVSVVYGGLGLGQHICPSPFREHWWAQDFPVWMLGQHWVP